MAQEVELDSTLVQPGMSLALLQGFRNGVCQFCSLKIDQDMHEIGAMLNPFSRARVLNKNPTVWPTANTCIPPSYEWIASSHCDTVWYAHPSKSFNLSFLIQNLVKFQATKMSHPILESLQ